MALQTRPEPMNASPHHSKVKVSLTFSDPLYVAGGHISGKMEMECRADSGLGIGVMMVELFAIQELTSRDHSATSTFLHSRRLFQGPGLPPSNAVLPYPIPGDPPLPSHYFQARRGLTTFLFRFPVPPTSPSSINFGSGLARVKYEVRASVGVAWKGDKRLVTDKKEVDVVESLEEDFSRIDPEGVVVGENGKVWMQGRVVGGVAVAGQSACIKLQVKNHSSKKTTGLGITLTRSLHLPNVPVTEKPPLQITDTLTTVAFRGPEYVVQPGSEGVASLVFDVPKGARGVKGGLREGSNEEGRTTECLFEVRCIIGIRLGMGLASRDIRLDLPVTILHPSAVPDLPPIDPFPLPSPYPYTPPQMSPPPISPVPYLDRAQTPYAHPPLPMSPPLQPYVDQSQIWLPPPLSHTPNPYQYFSPPLHQAQPYYFPPPPQAPYLPPPRPSSAEPGPSAALHALPSGLPIPPAQQQQQHSHVDVQQGFDPQEGKGERASRIAHHLRMSSRHRSVSPQSHRFPLPAPPSSSTALQQQNLSTSLGQAVPQFISNNLSTSPTVSQAIAVPLSPQFTSNNLSTSPTGSQAIVHSPRPLLSPKHSYTVDPMTHNSLPKSDRVEELERMADEVDKQSKDLSGDIPKENGLEKTLPSPPVPSGKDRLLTPTRPRAEALFKPASSQSGPNENPPTPLAAITPVKFPRADLLCLPSGQESGLDALERRLLAEVGTRKLDKEEKHADVRTVLPINIPTAKNAVPEALNDSAISSLTLADHDRDSDERTHLPGRTSLSDEDREVSANVRGRREGKAKSDGGKVKDGVKKKERGKDEEAQKLRKAAKGRVAAWLGRIDPDAPPLIDPPLVSPSILGPEDKDPITLGVGPEAPKVATTANNTSPTKKDDDTGDKDVSSAPNPRSSGFVPIATLNQRRTEAKENSVIREPTKPVAETKAKSTPFAAPTAKVAQSPKVDRTILPPSSQPKFDIGIINGKKGWMDPRSAPPPKPELPFSKKNGQLSPRLPAYPPPSLDSEVKYDIRSARGGRGGKVTAVASIWASATQSGDSADAKPKPIAVKPTSVPNSNAKPIKLPAKSPLSPSSPSEPKVPEFSANRARLIKSSVPAVISSSHATPTLSSTASLARPSPVLDRNKSPIKLPPTIPEVRSESTEIKVATPRSAGVKSPPPGDLAFGQARLRDLIKKYQGQSS